MQNTLKQDISSAANTMYSCEKLRELPLLNLVAIAKEGAEEGEFRTWQSGFRCYLNLRSLHNTEFRYQ